MVHAAATSSVFVSPRSTVRSRGDTHTLRQTADTHLRDAIGAQTHSKVPLERLDAQHTHTERLSWRAAGARTHELAGALLLLLLAGCVRPSIFVYHGMSGIGG